MLIQGIPIEEIGVLDSYVEGLVPNAFEVGSWVVGVVDIRKFERTVFEQVANFRERLF